MAELAVRLVLQNLGPLLMSELGVLKKVHKDVKSLSDELEFIQSYLEDADAKAENEMERELVKKPWVKQVREVAYCIEDVIDEYVLHLTIRHCMQNGFFNSIQKVFHVIINLKKRHDTSFDVQDIKQNLIEIKERVNHLINTSRNGSDARRVEWHDPRSGLIEEVVGIESPRDELISWLVKDQSKRLLMSVVGPGGLGKTTLVEKVYDNEEVKRSFDCHCWISVSKIYIMKDLLRSMIIQLNKERQDEFIPKELDTMEERSLMVELKEILQEKRYVLVFDDVWNTEFWGYIRPALPDSGQGGRIIITTQVVDIAPSDHVHKLLPLSSDQARELFCKNVFQSEGFDCSPKLKKLSQAIIDKCEGLPLAINVIGAALSTKVKDDTEWEKIHKSLGLELRNNKSLQSITKILSFSYHDLPLHLKPCFLYFGMFPEDYSIDCKKLFRLWIAEGFVEENQGQILEDVAKGYLNQLIRRSLVQVVKVNIFGEVSFCRIHNMMHVVILSRSEELSFRHVSVKHNSSFGGIPRRLSIQNNTNTISESIASSQTRSILVFKASEFSKDLVTALFTNLKFVKILDFEDVPIDVIPEKVGNMLHLKYLSLKNTQVKKLPKFISKLHNLETLDLRYSLIDELPAEIRGLRKLQYLLAYNNRTRAVKIQNGIGRLECLLTLACVEANCTGIVKELGSLRKLRTLGMSKLKRENGTALCTALLNMQKLQWLSVISTNEGEYLELQSLSSPPPLLQTVILDGRLENLPNWISELKCVVQISLYRSRLMEDPLKVLQALPNLMEIDLLEAYDGDQLYFKKGGFQKLKKLRLKKLKGLNKLIIEEGALHVLEVLEIGPCSQMMKLPTDIHYLNNLKTLNFFDMPREFVLSLQQHRGQDFSQIKHIPAICFNYMTEGQRYKIYKVGDPNLLKLLQGDSSNEEAKCTA